MNGIAIRLIALIRVVIRFKITMNHSQIEECNQMSF